nr:classical arabinogalactan protein 4-like [Vulpes vulpes]
MLRKEAAGSRVGSPAPTGTATPPRSAGPRAGSGKPRAGRSEPGPLSRWPPSPRSPAPRPRGGARAQCRAAIPRRPPCPAPGGHVMGAAQSDDAHPA